MCCFVAFESIYKHKYHCGCSNLPFRNHDNLTLPTTPHPSQINDQTKTTMPIDTGSNKGGAEGAVKAGTSTVRSIFISISKIHMSFSNTSTGRKRPRRHHQDRRRPRRHSWPRRRRDHQQHHRHQGCRRRSPGHYWRHRGWRQLCWQGRRERRPGEEELVKHLGD